MSSVNNRVADPNGLHACGLEAPGVSEFSEVLVPTLRRREVSQLELAERLEVTRASVNDWCKGRATPAPPTVIAIEKALGVDHGTLSRVLGYIAIEAYDALLGGRIPTIEDMISGSPLLNDDARYMLRTLYAECVILSDPHRRHGLDPRP